jgi:hypothetical protein
VNGALVAASLVSMQREAASTRGHLGVVSNVALRGSAEPKVGNEHVGNFVSFVQTFHDVGPDTPMWDLARECKQAIAEHIATGEAEGRLGPGQLKWWQRGALRLFAPRLDNGVGNALAVSNSGRLALAASHGAFTLDGVYAASSQHFMGSSIALFVWSVADAMQIVVGCVEPLVPKARAERVADAIVAMLRV